MVEPKRIGSVMSSDLRALEEFDTPTICNALEMIEPGRRAYGYTRSNLFPATAEQGPRVGVARTATMRSMAPAEKSRDDLKRARLRYYEYMHTPCDMPKACLMQDLDGENAGTGPFWGEFNTRIHRAMGFTMVITDGSARDVTNLPDDILVLSRGLRPSHAYVHVVDFGGQVNVCGMTVADGDVVHADLHGAVAFPLSMVPEISRCAREFVAAEKPIIDACRRDELSFEELARLYLAR
jgi:hypothetical protein